MTLVVAEVVITSGSLIHAETRDEPWIPRLIWWHLMIPWLLALAAAYALHRGTLRTAARTVERYLAIEASRILVHQGPDSQDHLMIEASVLSEPSLAASHVPAAFRQAA